ncbi:hypothetical protein [Citromicrobium bathyomarinum]|uniref:hypothetical protein n=1 Tax=Citromicrobium bathyomarinum TaxID=72174 RepID=UPI001E3B42D6|nr:hypothetical protein [Citromicrobium bathyomarinum]MCD1621402.1 hypothetical protein [Citromicrobium bathyomarinum]
MQLTEFLWLFSGLGAAAPWVTILIASSALYVTARQYQITLFKSIIEEIGAEDVRRIRRQFYEKGVIEKTDAARLCVGYDRVSFYIIAHAKIPIFGRKMYRLLEGLHGDTVRKIGPDLFRMLLVLREIHRNPDYCYSLEQLLRRYKIQPSANSLLTSE